jgi:membrane-associated phospholipid phosphatase
MKKYISERLAIRGLLAIQSLSVVLHLLILSGIVPYEIAWGGRIKNQEEMIRFESVSILLNLLMLAIVAIRAGLLAVRLNYSFTRGALWFMFGLFVLNTVGNILSDNQFEQLVFTPVTMILAVFSLRLAINNPTKATA